MVVVVQTPIHTPTHPHARTHAHTHTHTHTHKVRGEDALKALHPVDSAVLVLACVMNPRLGTKPHPAVILPGRSPLTCRTRCITRWHVSNHMRVNISCGYN